VKFLITVYSVLILILFITVNLLAQAPDTLWTRTYGGFDDDWANSVQQTFDGGYIVAGWTESFGAGGNDFYLIKTDSNGDTLWTRTYGGPFSDNGYSVQETSDSGYIIVGYTYISGRSDEVYIIKTNVSGDTLWTKMYGGTDSDLGHSVQQTYDGGYIIVGTTFSFGAGSRDVYLIKTDGNGNTLWTKTYGGPTSDIGWFVQQTSDSGYIIVGNTDSYGAGASDVYLIKTDTQGNALWTKTFGGTNSEDGLSVKQTSGGGYIIAGWTNSFGAGDDDYYLIKTDSNGNAHWSETYGGSREDNAFSVVQTTDGGYTVVGFSYFTGTNAEVFLIKTDSLGNSEWSKYYGGPSYERGHSLQITSDGGYIISGVTFSFGSGGADVYLIKTLPYDTIPPLIDSTTVWIDTTYAGPFPVYTKVTDNTGVETVLLYFKRTEDPSWFSTEMLVGGVDWYYGEIPQAFLYNDTIKYYIYASDIAQPANEATDPPGAPANYYSFIANMVGIEEYQIAKHNPKLENIKIFPNPFMNVLRIEGCSGVKIYDISGRFVAEVKDRWDGKNAKGKEVKAGFYFLKSEGLHIGKVIKLR